MGVVFGGVGSGDDGQLGVVAGLENFKIDGLSEG
jgi:hypothetical protein